MFPRRPTNPGNSDTGKTVYFVRGTVLNPNGKPFAGGLVRAFDRDLRSEQLLGEARTDAQGGYEIRYPADQFLQAEADSADLAVKVFSARGELLYEPDASEILYNAPVEAVVDIILRAGDTQVESEIERLVRDITPLLQDVRLENLQEDKEHQDITFLNKETGWPAEALEMVVVAFRIGRLSKVDPAFFYALLRRQSLFKVSLASAVQAHFSVTLASDPRGLLYEAVLLDQAVIRREVKAAIAAALVPASLADQLDRILEQLSAFRQEAEDYQRKQVPAQVLNLVQANLAAGKEQEVIRILQQDAGGNFAGLIQQLSQVSLFTSPDAANEAGTRLQLADLLGFDNQIIDSVRKIQGLQKPEDLRKLAALNKTGWQNLLTQSAQQITAGGKPLDPRLAGLHASALVRKMEARYPTAAFAAQLGRDDKNHPPSAQRRGVFFGRQPRFQPGHDPRRQFSQDGCARDASPGRTSAIER